MGMRFRDWLLRHQVDAVRSEPTVDGQFREELVQRFAVGEQGYKSTVGCHFPIFQRAEYPCPNGFALGGDGRFYAGGHDAAHMFMLHSPSRMEGTRYCGALCWYDPQTETIGVERGPFLHHVVTHICAVGDDYIAMVAKADANPFDPRPDHSEGKFALFYLHSRRFVHDEDLTGRKLLYVAEGQPVKWSSPLPRREICL